jgi:hypothetical protein
VRGLCTITRIEAALLVSDPEALRDIVAGHLSSARPVGSGLELYYALERTTSLLEFHTMLREGERNRTRDGLQQSYGDHNRLLMLALDRLLAGDVGWLRNRVAVDATVDEASLRSCALTAGGLDLTPEVELAVWLGAALHDCGVLRGQGAHVDVEDGLALAQGLLEELCPPSTRPLAAFALRHHDYVKDAFLGEAPVSAIADDLDALEPEVRPVALMALGLIQVAGASSLGEGRLTQFRLDIFHACADGTAVADRAPELRLARLLAPSPDARPPGVRGADVHAARGALRGVVGRERDDLDALLDRVFVHGWHHFVAGVGSDARLRALVDLAGRNRTWAADHLVLDTSVRARGAGVLPATPQAARDVALSGAVTVAVGA